MNSCSCCGWIINFFLIGGVGATIGGGGGDGINVGGVSVGIASVNNASFAAFFASFFAVFSAVILFPSSD